MDRAAFDEALKDQTIEEIKALVLRETGRPIGGAHRADVLGAAFDAYSALMAGEAPPPPPPVLDAGAFGGPPPEAAPAPPPAPRKAGPLSYEMRSKTGQPLWLTFPGGKPFCVGVAYGSVGALNAEQVEYLRARKRKLVDLRIEK